MKRKLGQANAKATAPTTIAVNNRNRLLAVFAKNKTRDRGYHQQDSQADLQQTVVHGFSVRGVASELAGFPFACPPISFIRY